MKLFHFPLMLLVLALAGPSATAQVTIGSNQAPDPASVLDLQSTQGGLLLPRLTTQQRNALLNPPEGLTLYNTDTKCTEGWFPTGWKALACDCQQAPPAPVAVVAPPKACPGDTMVLFYTPAAIGATSYQWTIDSQDTLLGNASNDSIWVNFSGIPGNRSIGVRAVNACGASPSTQLSFDVSQPSAGFSSVPTQPSVNSPASFSANSPGLSYAWTFQNGNPGSSNLANPQVTWSQAGNVLVALQVTDQAGCSDTVVQSIGVVNCLPAQNQTLTFNYTGSVQNWTVPSGVCLVTLKCWGAQGGAGHNGTAGGQGGYAEGQLTVVGGQTLYVFVGEKGHDANNYSGVGTTVPGGWNGGGYGGSESNDAGRKGGAGGGASDVRFGGQNLADRVIVAGGGGGSGYSSATGGNGGGTSGSAGNGYNSGVGGTGASQSAGGLAATLGRGAAHGSLGQGGNGSHMVNAYGGAGGGGGYYGGGGGTSTQDHGSGWNAGGGGGSGYVGGLSNSTLTTGGRTGHGMVQIQY